MRFNQTATIGAAIFLTSTGAALAEKITVPADQTTVIVRFGDDEKPGCRFKGRPNDTIAVKSAHGSIEFKWTLKALFNKCFFRPTYRMTVWYTPDPGYRGEDYVYFYGEPTSPFHGGWPLYIKVK